MAAKLKYTRQDGFVHPGWLLGVRVLMLAALAVAAYLLWISVGSGASAGCGPNSNCDKVLHSRWSRWLGVPISAVGLLVYGAILAGTFWLRRSVPPADQRKAWGWLIPCSIAVIGAAIWFAAVQGLILKKFCPFCLTAHACAAVAAVILLWCAPFRRPPEKPWQQEKQVFVPPGSGRKLAWMGLVPVTVLIAGQIVRWPQREYVVKIFDGKIQMNLREVPVIGAPDAPHSIISLFDYTCDPCRTMHGHLMAAHQKFSNELAIINLPMPLCEKCNHTVKRSPPVHANACEYARIGLALWRADPKAQSRFDEWIFGPASLPSLAEARQYAGQLVGSAALGAALKDPWIEEQIQRDIAIYETNSLRGVANMPQLMIGTNVTAGTFGQVTELYRLLEQNLGMVAAGALKR